MCGVFLFFACNAKADEIRVTANAVFQEPNGGSDQQFIFSSTFLFELETNQLVPGSISTHVTDTFPGTPYTNWVPKPNFHGPTFTYFDPDLDEVQLLFDSPGAPQMFPAVGSYPFTDIAVICVTFACADHFSPFVLVPVSGDLSVAAVPEPAMAISLAAGALFLTLAFAAKAKLFRP